MFDADSLLLCIVILPLCVACLRRYQSSATFILAFLGIVWVFLSPVNSADLLSRVMMGMTFITMMCVALCSTSESKHLSSFLVMQSLLLAAFAASSMILFYICWECLLIPVVWNMVKHGTSKAHKGSDLAFFFFIQAIPSLGLLLSFVIMSDAHDRSWVSQTWVLMSALLAITAKLPMMPWHGWLVRLCRIAPMSVAGSSLFSLISIKLALYALLKWILPFCSDAAIHWGPWIMFYAVFSMLYLSWLNISSKTIDRWFGYALSAHMGFFFLSCFGAYQIKNAEIARSLMEYGCFHMVGHTLGTLGLWVCLSWLYGQSTDMHIHSMQGMASKHPWFAATMALSTFSFLGMPGTSGFLGEWGVLLGIFKSSQICGIAMTFAFILTAVYTLRLYHQICLGPFYLEKRLNPMLHGHRWALALLASGMLALGMMPQMLMRIIQTIEFPI